MIKSKKSFKIKKGDNVKIISGKFKGQTGIVNSIIKKTNSITIENINIKVKHTKPKQSEEKGEIRKIEGPIHYSNVTIIKATK